MTPSELTDLFKAGQYQSVIQEVGAEKTVCAYKYNLYGMSLLYGGLYTSSDDVENVSLKDGDNIYSDFYRGAILYDEGDFKAGSLISRNSCKIAAFGPDFPEGRCSWLRGVTSFYPKNLSSTDFTNAEFDFEDALLDLSEVYIAAVNTGYFKSFFKGLCDSFLKHAQPAEAVAGLVVNIINPTDEVKKFVEYNKYFLRARNVFFSFSFGDDNKWYYTMVRFMLAKKLLDKGVSAVMTIDADSIFAGSPTEMFSLFRDVDLSYRCKKRCLPWQKIQATRIFVRNSVIGMNFVELVVSYFRSYYSAGVDQWFIDQNALEYARLESGGKESNMNNPPFSDAKKMLLTYPGGAKKKMIGKLSNY